MLPIFVLPLLLALFYRWPTAGLYTMLICACAIEQDALFTPVGTDRLPIYHWPTGLEGLIERPIGLLFVALLAIVVYQHLRAPWPCIHAGALFPTFAFYLLCVAAGAIHGLAHGGLFKIVVIEVRPFWYLFLSYLIAYNLVQKRQHVDVALWLVVGAAALKSLQALYICFFVLHGNWSEHHEIMAHEESYFFVGFLLLAVLFCLQRGYRRHRYISLAMTPCIIFALIANQRRTDYLALLIGLLVSWTLAFCFRAYSRKGLFACFMKLAARIPLCFNRGRKRHLPPSLGLHKE